MGDDPKDPAKQNITPDPNAETPAAKPGEQLSEEELAKTSGGVFQQVAMAHNVCAAVNPGISKTLIKAKPGIFGADGDPFVKISGPSWVNLMAYRKAGWEAEPKRKGSLAELHKELAAESADDE